MNTHTDCITGQDHNVDSWSGICRTCHSIPTIEVKRIPVAETVKLMRDAQGGHCATCDQTFNITTSPYWDWSKSVAMHRSGSGHTVNLYRLVAAA